MVTFTVWREVGLDVDYLQEDDHIIWTKIDTDPSKVMYDMHGRTTGLDEDKSLLIDIWRIATSYFNVESQYSKGSSAESKSLFPGRKAWREEMHGYYERGEMPPHELFLGPPTILDEVYNGIDIQRRIWAAGAEVMYGLGKEFTWYTLMNSLSDNPQPVLIEEGVSYLFDDIITKFKRNSYVRGEIDAFLADKTESFPRMPTNGLNLKSAHDYDLFAAMNKCNMWITGEKNEDGSWNLYIEMTDIYDFTERLRVFESDSIEEGIGRAANNAAIISQDLGAITTYPIEVRFTMKNYIPFQK